jgi:hypothetical protein
MMSGARWIAAASLLILAAGCGKDHDLDPSNPRDPYFGGAKPPVPTDVQITVGNRSVAVAWELPDSDLVNRVRSYRIYQRTEVDGAPELADS